MTKPMTNRVSQPSPHGPVSTGAPTWTDTCPYAPKRLPASYACIYAILRRGLVLENSRMATTINHPPNRHSLQGG